MKEKVEKLIYRVVIALAFILFVVNFVRIFTTTDDTALQSITNTFYAFLMIVFVLLPFVLEKKLKIKLSKPIHYSYLILCILQFFCGSIGMLYVNSSFWDILMHALTAIMIVAILYVVFETFNDKLNLGYVTRGILTLTITVTLCVCWEMSEFIIDILFNKNMQRYLDPITKEAYLGQNALIDTMKDLIVDFGFSFIASVLGFLDLKNNKLLYKACYINKTE